MNPFSMSRIWPLIMLHLVTQVWFPSHLLWLLLDIGLFSFIDHHAFHREKFIMRRLKISWKIRSSQLLMEDIDNIWCVGVDIMIQIALGCIPSRSKSSTWIFLTSIAFTIHQKFMLLSWGELMAMLRDYFNFIVRKIKTYICWKILLISFYLISFYWILDV